jgi:hypothetical protein
MAEVSTFWRRVAMWRGMVGCVAVAGGEMGSEPNFVGALPAPESLLS